MAAVYILYMFQKMFLGPQGEIVEDVKSHGSSLRDLNWREIATVIPLLIFIFWIGLYPKPFFDLMAPAVDQLVAALQTASLAMP
jgi:NADH-quinone oxidoreductase subunit M